MSGLTNLYKDQICIHIFRQQKIYSYINSEENEKQMQKMFLNVNRNQQPNNMQNKLHPPAQIICGFIYMVK
jgi:hypothetical protein